LRGLRPLLACCALLLAWAAPAAAQAPPVRLPDAAGASQTSTWLIGVTPGTRVAGARRVADGTFVVARARARALAARLRARGALVFAEPDRTARRSQSPGLSDPLSASSRWREAVVNAATIPPGVAPDSPLLALVDSAADVAHPEFEGGNFIRDGDPAPFDLHGTATGAVAAAPDNERGILGIWPGMRAANVPLPSEIRCSDSVAGIERAIALGAAVINLSYGSSDLCFAEYVSIQRATAGGIVVVAASGNEFTAGNPLVFPASLPHVVTVAAVGADLRSAFFSSTSAAIDLSAPGVGVLTAVPAAFDQDGTQDGYMAVDGTSFAAPMVAAAAAWVRAARPELAADQIAQVIRLGARDIDREGWDPSTGFGLLDIDASLARRPPPRDPLEPNDDVVWIDGRAFTRPDPLVWSGRGSRRLRGLLDRYEDPHDVYRVRLLGRSSSRLYVRPTFGNADLEVLRPGAKSFADQGVVVGRSRRNGRATDRVTITNRGRRARVAYVHAYIDRRAKSLDAGYVLTVRRAAFSG
jgi:subtilisin family serine protease